MVTDETNTDYFTAMNRINRMISAAEDAEQREGVSLHVR